MTPRPGSVPPGPGANVLDLDSLPQPFSRQVGTYRGLAVTLEDKIVLALLELGWRCAQFVPRRATGKAAGSAADGSEAAVLERTVARQWCPQVVDARTGKRRAYRLDFAHPATRVALEVDGYNRRGGSGGRGGHVTWSGFHSDRERDRNLTLAGWRVLRCGPDDLKTPADALVIAEQFLRLIGALTAGAAPPPAVNPVSRRGTHGT